MPSNFRLNRLVSIGLLICIAFVAPQANLGFAPSPTRNAQQVLPPIEPGKPATLTLPGLPAACASQLVGAYSGEALIGIDPQTCAPAKEPTHVYLDVPVKAPTADMLAVVTVRCTGERTCLENRVPSIGIPAQFSLGLNETRLWSWECIQGATCDALAPPRDIQFTFRVPASGVYPLDFMVSPGAVWRVSAIEVAVEPLPDPQRMIGYAYSPYRDCQSPTNGLAPTPDEVNEDLRHLLQASNAIRTYSSLGINQEIAVQARELGFTLGIGIDLSKDQKKNEQEIQAARKFAKQVQADFVIVGNEVILRGELNPAQVARYLSRVKKDTGLPVAYAEVTSGFVELTPTGEMVPKKSMAPIVKAADMILVHIYPYWDGAPIEQGAAYVATIYAKFKELYPDKRVVIGETGWPSRGNQNGNAIPSLENQRRFFLEFTALAAQKGIEYFYFSPYEEPWKAPEAGEIGISWGINTPERWNKFETDSLFFPREIQAAGLKPGPIFAPLATGTIPGPILTGTAGPTGQPELSNEPYVLYREFPPPQTMSPSWWQGDLDDIYVTDCSKSFPHSGHYAMQVRYSAESAQEPDHVGWAGTLWEYPEKNRAKLKDGRNLSQYKSLRFFARGENGGEKVAFLLGGTQTGSYPSSIRQPLIMEVTLEQGWQEYAFDLRGQDLSHVIDGFGWVASSCKNPSGVTFYLDDIEYSTEVIDQQVANEFPILEDGCLNTGFDLGIDTSGKMRKWASAAEDALKLAYPTGQQWGAAYLYVNQKLRGGRPYIDLSEFSTIEIEMRGENGGEKVSVGVKDNSDPDNGKEIKKTIELSNEFKPYRFSLADFQIGRFADPAKMYIPVEFVFGKSGAQPETIYIRSVRFVK
jgi:exo-beta-1,3-glucanase (GH17 family)